MRDFFETILPDKGIYFIASIKDSRCSHHTCHTFDEMVTKAEQLDEQGYNVYYACASYERESYLDPYDGKVKRRTQKNVGWAKSFWIDLDCGLDKAEAGDGYLKKKEALIALDKFIQAVGLPNPCIVRSGGGFHVYFLLEKTITKEEWLPLATKLKEMTQCPRIRLLADDAVTADIARILRPIGTHNYKPAYEKPEVTRESVGMPVIFEEFSFIINEAHKKYCFSLPTIKSHAISPVRLTYSEPDTLENIEKAKSALAAIDPDCDYDTWVEICFAINSTGWICAEDLARSWSKGELK